MGEAIISRRGGSGNYKGEDVEYIAGDKLKIGDIVYTIEGTIEGDINETGSTVYTASFSPNGNTLVLGGTFTGYAKVYSVSGTTITCVSNIYADAGTTPLDNSVYSAAFSPNGNTLVLGGNFVGWAKVYSVLGTTITYVSNIYADAGTTALSGVVRTAAFSPNGNTLVLTGIFTGYAKVYSISGTTVTYISDIYANIGTTALSNYGYSAAFSPNGDTLVLGGHFAGRVKIYSVSGTTVTYKSDIYANAGTTPFSAVVYSAAFSPNGDTFVLGGEFTGRAKVYELIPTSGVLYQSDIYANAGTTALSDTVWSAAFSPNGNTLVLGGTFTGYAKVYSVSGTTITYASDIYANAGTTPLSDTVRSAAFSPDGNTLVLGGAFTGYAKVYSISGTTITYKSNIYASLGATPLNAQVYSAAFSPNGNTLVLGGNFGGYAKVYSVSGTTITFVSNIYAEAGTTSLNNPVYSAAFSPDGNTLVLGGSFTGCAKVYSVSGTTITYVSNIYADAGTTALSDTVWSAAFSPNGNTLVLGGAFTGYAKVYSVSGTTITCVSNIYADAGTTSLNHYVLSAAFSPKGNILVLGGVFTGCAKVYSVSGTTITYVSNIYADAGTTPLSATVYTTAFSPNGNTLVLGGQFNGRAKVYSVDQLARYLMRAYKPASLTTLSPARRINEVQLGVVRRGAEEDKEILIRVLEE